MKESSICAIINQLFEIERKLETNDRGTGAERHLNRIKTYLSMEGYHYHDPLHEAYDLTRTDCEATLIGEKGESWIISEVIKPIIWKEANGQRNMVQQAVVLAEPSN
ncbi:MAG: hypothetical protein AAGI38_22960 [Bacteroidota bacterium]